MNETHVLLKLLLTNITNEQRRDFYDYMIENGWQRHESVETVWSIVDKNDIYNSIIDIKNFITNGLSTICHNGEKINYNAIVQIGNNEPIEFP